MTDSTATLHQRVLAALVEDPVLAALGFDHRTIGADPSPRGPGLRISWSDDWSVAGAGLLGVLTVEPTGVGDGTRAVVLDRVGTALAQAHRPGGPVQVRRHETGEGTFLVFAPTQGVRTSERPALRR